MDTSYRQFFALQKEPFGSDIVRKDIMLTKPLVATQERIQYALRLGAVVLVTGEIGSGKSTTLRYVLGGLHPSEFKVISVTATSGSIMEIYRQILGELGS
jgi:general secretion pathway protein A